MTDRQPTGQEPEYIITESQLKSIEKWDTRHLGKEFRSRPYSPAPTKQCENCRLIGTRACMFHGYPESAIPKYCHFKIGNCAEEALRNLNGTTIDVWTPEHDEAIRQSERENVLDELTKITNLSDCTFPDEECGCGCFLRIIESLRAGKEPE